MAIDAAGAAHVAAVGTGSDNMGLWYLTNVTGRWVKQQLTSPLVDENDNIGQEGEPSIAIDPTDGSVWIAFTRWDCADCTPSATLGIFYVTNQGGTWSEPVQLSRGWDLGPSLAVRNGHLYVSYSTTGFPGDPRPVWFASDASGILVTQEVAKTGRSPHLVLDANNRAQILFSTDGLRFARQRAVGTFAIERLPGASGRLNSRLVLDSVTRSYWAAWTAYVGDGPDVNILVASRGPDGWSDPTWAITEWRLQGLGAYDGLVQLTAMVEGNDYCFGLTYANNDTGTLEARWTLDPSCATSSAFALGQTGRPYVVFTGDEPGIWFLKGPEV